MRKTLTLTLLVASIGVVNAQSFLEGFENGPAEWNDESRDNYGNSTGGDAVAFDSGTWHFLNESNPEGDLGWFNAGVGTVDAHSGVRQAGVNFLSTDGANDISNWMMSPVRSFNNGDIVSFWTVTPDNDFPDRLHLKLSLAGASTATSDFAITLVTVNPNLGTEYPTVHTQFTATITGLAGATEGRLGFHYDVTDGGPDGTNSNYIGIDDVSYEAVPEPATMAILAAGAAALMRRRKKQNA